MQSAGVHRKLCSTEVIAHVRSCSAEPNLEKDEHTEHFALNMQFGFNCCQELLKEFSGE